MRDRPDSPPPSSEGEAASTNESDSPSSPPASASNIRSILGLAAVSALNLGCIAFIGFHFTAHSDEPVRTEKIELRPGNVSLEPAPTFLLTIASHVEPASSDAEEQDVDMAVATRPVVSGKEHPLDASPPPAKPEETTVPPKTGMRWVQLGALSNMTTAQSYWEKLQENHDGLLASHQPDFIGPNRVGGSLYLVRVGPLPAAVAADLCSDLKRAGADCFCVGAGV